MEVLNRFDIKIFRCSPTIFVANMAIFMYRDTFYKHIGATQIEKSFFYLMMNDAILFEGLREKYQQVIVLGNDSCPA